MPKLKITKQYAKEFDDKCAKADSHGFLRFFTKRDANHLSLLDLIAVVEDAIKIKPTKHDRYVELNEQKIANCVNEFFSLYMPQKAEEVRQIFNRTHPYFIDQDGITHINFIHTQQGDPHSSNVGHSGRCSFLEFNVYIHNSLDDLRTTAHELTHALSSHHQHVIETLRSNVPMREIDNYAHKNFEKDCVGEIESHITEKLFNKFLFQKGIYTIEDLENYENQQQACLLTEINLIREERDIIKKLSCPVSYESLKNLVAELQRNRHSRLIERIRKMHDDNKCSSYMFRYVVGRIVADQWIKRFDKAQDHQTQLDMLDKFQNYLDRTHEFNLDSACENLLGENFASIVEAYVMDKTNEAINLDEKAL